MAGPIEAATKQEEEKEGEEPRAKIQAVYDKMSKLMETKDSKKLVELITSELESARAKMKTGSNNAVKSPEPKDNKKFAKTSPNETDNIKSKKQAKSSTNETEKSKLKSEADAMSKLLEPKDTKKLLKPIVRLENGHSDVVMDIVPMVKVQMIATCSLDKSIILWSTLDYRKVRVYKEHMKGVVSLTFNESLILLISAGYDHQICIWNPYIGKLYSLS